MVEEFTKILNILTKQNKPVWLFACLKMDEFVDKWSLIFSAPWITEENGRTELLEILEITKKNLNDENLSSIARIVFMSKDEHLIEELLKKNSGEEINDERINGNIIHEGYIIESNPNLIWNQNIILFK